MPATGLTPMPAHWPAHKEVSFPASAVGGVFTVTVTVSVRIHPLKLSVVVRI